MEAGSRTLDNAFRRIPLGRKALLGTSKLAETLGMFPKGSADVIGLLDRTAKSLCGRRQGRDYSHRCTVSWLANPFRPFTCQSQGRFRGALDGYLAPLLCD